MWSGHGQCTTSGHIRCVALLPLPCRLVCRLTKSCCPSRTRWTLMTCSTWAWPCCCTCSPTCSSTRSKVGNRRRGGGMMRAGCLQACHLGAAITVNCCTHHPTLTHPPLRSSRGRSHAAGWPTSRSPRLPCHTSTSWLMSFRCRGGEGSLVAVQGCGGPTAKLDGSAVHGGTTYGARTLVFE